MSPRRESAGKPWPATVGRSKGSTKVLARSGRSPILKHDAAFPRKGAGNAARCQSSERRYRYPPLVLAEYFLPKRNSIFYFSPLRCNHKPIFLTPLPKGVQNRTTGRHAPH